MALLLEAFDERAADGRTAPPSEAGAAPGPPPDWLAGHAEGHRDGLAQGLAEARAEAGALSRELAQGLSDMAFGYAEARGQVLASLQPLLRLVVERLLPEMAAEALGPWLAEAVLAAARADTARLVIAVHPDRLAAVRACLPAGAAGPVTLLADATLGAHAARLAAPEGETDLDLDACLAGLREALSALLDPATRKVRHA